MSFLVDYKLSHKEIKRLELISQINGNLQVLRMNPDWADLLERDAGIKEAVGSIGIEGTVLSLVEAKAITTGDGDVKVGEKEKREYIAYADSLKHVKERLSEKLNTKLLLNLHEKITKGNPDAKPGQIRNDQRGVSSHGKMIYLAPPAEQLNYLVKEFIDWFNATAEKEEISPIIAASICHFWFVWIHPFSDGNGRAARLLTTFLLLKMNAEGIRYFALSDYYNTHKDEYYDALEVTNKCDPKTPAMNFKNTLTPWVRFFIDSYLEQMQSIKGVTNRILQLNIRIDRLRKQRLITESHNKLLSFLTSRERASIKEIAKHMNISRPRVQQIMRPLRKALILVEETVGREKWFMLGSPENEPNESVFKEKKRKAIKIDSNLGTSQVLPIFQE